MKKKVIINYTDFWANCVLNDLFSILTSVNECLRPFTYMNSYSYIQRGIYDWWRDLSLKVDDDYCQAVNDMITYSSIENIQEDNILDTVRTIIEHGRAVYVPLDVYYVKSKYQFEYMTTHSLHDVMIADYDDERQTFTAIGYREYEISADDLVTAFKSSGSCSIREVSVAESIEKPEISIAAICKNASKLICQLNALTYIKPWVFDFSADKASFIFHTFTAIAERQLANKGLFTYLRDIGHISGKEYEIIAQKALDINQRWCNAKNLYMKSYYKKIPPHTEAINIISGQCFRLESEMWRELIVALGMDVCKETEYQDSATHLGGAVCATESCSVLQNNISYIRCAVKKEVYRGLDYVWMCIFVGLSGMDNFSDLAIDKTLFAVTLPENEQVEIYDVIAHRDYIEIITDIYYFNINSFDSITLSYCGDLLLDKDRCPLPPFTVGIQQYKGASPFVNYFSYSEPLEGSLEETAYPSTGVVFTPICINTNILSINSLYEKTEVENKLVYFKFMFKAYHETDIELLLGYSGIVKVWLNGLQVYISEKNSDVVDFFNTVIPVHYKKSTNELIICMKVKFPKNSDQDILTGLALKLRLNDAEYAAGKYLPYILSDCSVN